MRAGPRVIAKSVGEELLLLEPATRIYQSLDEVGARIWQLVTSGRSFDETIVTLLDEYEVSREQLQRDVEQLLGELQRDGFLV